VIAEGNETSGSSESGGAGEGRGRSREGDLLAERRARRAAESGEHALTLRAEAAEATVRTLETHVASLQRRLQDTEEEQRQVSEQLDTAEAAREREQAELGRRMQPPLGEPVLERELQRASQREYAEQRLRMEAEDRAGELERESRAEIDRLRRRLGASEREAQSLALRLETLERELAEAEQTAAAERAEGLRTERELRAQVGSLERHASELRGALVAERSAREHAEGLLEELRRVQRGALGLLGGLADTVARLRDAAITTSPPAPPAPSAQAPLARKPPLEPKPWPASEVAPAAPPRAEAPLARPEAPRAPHVPEPTAMLVPIAREPRDAAQEARGSEMAEALAAAVERLRARVEEQPAPATASVQARAPHKHSMSLLTRTRLALKRRGERRKQRRAAS
jgi:hypothetical protein